MSRTISIAFEPAAGGNAGLGVSGRHTLIADRPDGVAGGLGLGFNGGELFAAALGGCFWNDLHYAAARIGLAISVQAVDVEITLSDPPVRIVAARIHARLAGERDAIRSVYEAAVADSTVANSVAPAIAVDFALDHEGGNQP